ncbi:hypothetical protein FA341_15320 [Pseudomonas aeruginosa]|uniref:Uncharacterized protein n=1 Tax=Pseudomonas aeruginosa TaxID=287 RepID=A0A6C0L1E5_PSEAI|nr:MULTISPECIES: hypothetical protein [Pseudomonas aeruginosa group]AWE88991.1 hypothetical protein CSC28_6995 [Pseudomonas paraeruginosa]EIU2642765.1 hypothetical protein [Pseudomonas aeruginosa]EIU9551186.1 hypothetical protein [Pseudomonas aeruginosa]EKC7897293.1 hypothetical protein [Pseudomonas aeruginosa]EKO0513871.1 hypothetical protein [Pseudomonas aeruginosa]
MAKLTDSYWVQWRSYNAKHGGCCTHATEAGTDRALCGVQTVDGAGQTLTDTVGHVGCRRCLKVLQKRGVIPVTD